jgi:hypothetical protein
VTRPRLGRLVLALAVSLGLLVLTPGPSWACSCAAADTAKQVELAGTVASGTVDWTATDGQTRTYSVDFDAVYKGAAAASEKLVTNAHEASCGLADLAVGRRYLFFVEGRHPGAMRVGLCGGTVAYDASVAARVGAVTGPPGTPLPAPARDDPATSGGGPFTLGAALGLAALLVVVAVAVVRRNDRSG